MFSAFRREMVRLRIARGWTQDELGAASGQARRNIAYWEAGVRQVPEAAAPALVNALGPSLEGLWLPPQVHFPKDNRRPILPPYPVKSSIHDFHRYGYEIPNLHPAVVDEMEHAYPRDTAHELIGGFKVLGAGARLRWSSLDSLECPLLVCMGQRHASALRHLRHILLWDDIILVPQVSVGIIVQARVARLDWLAVCNGTWLDIEIDGSQRDEGLDKIRAWGLDLKELRYSNQAVLKTNFVDKLRDDIRFRSR